MDELLKSSINEVRKLGAESYVQQFKSDTAKVNDLNNFDHEIYEKIYAKAHAVLSFQTSIDESSVADILLFLLKFCSRTTSILHKIYISKSLLHITRSNYSLLTANNLSTLIEIYTVLVMSHSDIILHNVAASLLQSAHHFRDVSVIERIDQLCVLSEKFHLILLTYMLDNCKVPSFLKASTPFLQKGFSLCTRNAVRQNSTISAKIIAKLAQTSPESISINVNDLFNYRDRFHNQSCRSIFNSISPFIQDDLSLNRKACAVDLANTDIDNIHHIYDIETRFAALRFRSLNISQEELLVSFLSVLADCSPESHNLICRQTHQPFKGLSNENKLTICKYLDCRSRVRASQLILDVLKNEDIHTSLYNIIMYSSFAELRILAFKKFVLNNRTTLCQNVLNNITVKDEGWGMLMQYHFKGKTIVEETLSIFRSICSSDFQFAESSIILNCLQGLLLICRLGSCSREDESHFIFPQTYPLVQKCLDWIYELCLTETPESYSLQNTDDDYECRTEWKIAKFCVVFIVDSMKMRSLDTNYSDLIKVTDMTANLKHRGAYFCLYESILQMATHIFSNDCSYLYMFDSFCWDIIYSESDTKFCGRRSAGIPYIVKALLKSLPSVKQSDFSCITFDKLVHTSKHHRSELVRVRCVNILCELFSDKTLQDIHEDFGPVTLDLSFDLLASTSWAERNVGLRLFSSVYRREFDMKKDGDDLVDIRKLGKLPEILINRLSTPHEEHIYPLLVCLSHLKIPAHVLTLDTFIDAITRFLCLNVDMSDYYVAMLCQKISTSLRIVLQCKPRFEYFNDNGTVTWPDYISERFVPGSKREYFIGCSFIPDDAIEAFFDQFKNDPVIYKEILRFLEEGVSSTRRSKAAKYMLELGQADDDNNDVILQIAYRLIVDDDDDIRFYGCKLCHKIFKTNVICSTFYYVDRIWEHIGRQDTCSQSRLFHSMFWEDFSRDFIREEKNMKESPIFRSEPLNSYRDFFVEALMIRKYINLSQLSFKNEFSHYCSDVMFETSGYLMRSIKVLKILSGPVPS